MKKAFNTLRYGLYINRKKAVLVSIGEHQELNAMDFPSPFVPLHFAGETTTKTSLFGRTMNRQQKQQHKIEGDLKKWCRDLVARMTKAGQIFIFGPSDTKYQLQHEVEKRKALHEVCMEVETSGNLTRNQVISKVKKHFNVV